MQAYPYLFDTSHSVRLNLCIEWRRAILWRYLKKFSLFDVNGLYHPFALSRQIRKNLTRRKNILAIIACINKILASFNIPLKLFEAFVVIMQNRHSPSLDNSH